MRVEEFFSLAYLVDTGWVWHVQVVDTNCLLV